jgi:hypothetical protein
VLDLTLVERSALLVLMAENRPLREDSDLRRVHGVSLSKKQRETLQRCGLIATRRNPFTHTLTPKGWAWVSAETQALRPPGKISQGALYAVLNALGRYANRVGLELIDLFNEERPPPKSEKTADTGPRRQPPPPHRDRTQEELLQKAALVEVDESLALALQDQPVLDRAFMRLSKKASEDLQGAVKGAESAANLVLQWARRAAEKRAIVAVCRQGDEVRFDPMLHDSDEPLEEGARVLVRKVPVVRRVNSDRIVLARGRVEPI